jgi:chromate transporter
MVLVFIAIGIMRWPLQAVLLVAIPISIGVTFLIRRRGTA